MTDPSSVLKQGDVLRLQVSPQYAIIQILPNAAEAKDPNFPHNLHNAAELFLKLGMVPQAVKLKDCVDAILEKYQATPDGTSGVRLGQACVCWQCGYCGIPQDYTEEEEGNSSAPKQPAGPCANCKETNQINWVRIKNSDNTKANYLPWIEESAMTEEQTKELKAKKEKELAERRAAVEASVAAALAERQAK